MPCTLRETVVVNYSNFLSACFVIIMNKDLYKTTRRSPERKPLAEEKWQPTKAYYPNADLFKGVLMILVIVGHLLIGTISGHLVKFIIYSFHMSLFIAISGYLSNADRLSRHSFAQLAYKYRFRVIIPWLIAVLVYFIIIYHPHYLITDLIKMIAFYPFWYVPGLLLYVLVTWLLLKLKIALKIIMLLALTGSCCAFPFNALLGAQYTPRVSFHIQMVFECFKPNYYFFFTLGMFLRTLPSFKKATNIFVAAVSFLLFLADIFAFYNKGIYLILPTFYFLNICLIILSTAAIRKTYFPVIKIIQWLGKNSLAIYLWHALPLVLLATLLNTGKITFTQYYLYAILSQFTVIATIAVASRIRVINKYLFGVAEPENFKQPNDSVGMHS